MKTHHIIIAIHLLERLRKTHEETEKLAPCSGVFAHLLEKEELFHILESKIYHGDTEYEHPNFKEKSREKLLGIIKDEYYILEYMIEDVFGGYTL